MWLLFLITIFLGSRNAYNLLFCCVRRRIESQFNANSATAKSELLKRLDHLGNFLKLTDEEIGESLSLEGDIATMKIQLGYVEVSKSMNFLSAMKVDLKMVL